MSEHPLEWERLDGLNDPQNEYLIVLTLLPTECPEGEELSNRLHEIADPYYHQYWFSKAKHVSGLKGTRFYVRKSDCCNIEFHYIFSNEDARDNFFGNSFSDIKSHLESDLFAITNEYKLDRVSGHKGVGR